MLYRDGSQTKGGINLTRNLGQRVIGYLEGSAGRGTNLVDEAFQFGRQTGSLPAGAPTVLPDETNTRLEEQLAIGVSYTTESRITFNIEYELNQAAFTNRVWEQWFSAGSGQGARSASALELWLIRDYALDQEEPISRNSLFLRADWVDAFIPKLELVGLVAEDFRDGSALLQLGGDYFLSDHWTVGGLVIGYLGSRRSDFGSLPLEGSVLVKVARYF
ncbi:MAG TPA: hypothetical protein VK437_08495 [Steroidobacteraceae bacterium]|nr:hypothetical protein [Steroidobacteraceae bacterium]